MKKAIKEIFDFLPEKNLTNEYFYEHNGPYPVFSGQTENKGIVAFIDIYEHSEDCITFTTYGNLAGKIFFRTGQYTIGRNCMGLKPKIKYQNSINLEWFSYKFQNLFYRLRIGDPQGQRSLNQYLVEHVVIEIPDIKIQERELLLYKKANTLCEKCFYLLKQIEKLKESNIQYFNVKYEEFISKIFFMYGGNSGLTEEFIYNNQPHTIDKSLSILSSSTIKSTTLGFISSYSRPNNKELKIFFCSSHLDST